MVQKFSIFPHIFFIITCGAILVQSELTQILKKPYLIGNPGILPQGISFHKSDGLTENHSEDDVDPMIGDGTSNSHSETYLKKHGIALERPYLRSRSPGLLQQSVSKINSNTNSRDLKKKLIVPKRPYLRGNPGLLPQGVTFHKAISPSLHLHAVSPSVHF
ncbi:hypothetical protein HAX54_033963 [Datura stramonium]|uniref:Uncharacterized protein n=1 Tax=Datura stramonium TaxID=4076 RepID=A0ABS8SDS8_DATST|nr:hypothetical protein [Datura stramonium]